jgi:protein tyrosine/serine phosphatase
VVVAIAALVALSAAVYFIAARPNLSPKRFGVVEAGKLYRAGEITPAGLAKIARERGLRTVIDFGAHEPGSPEEVRESRSAAALGLTRFVLRLEGDGTGNLNNYARALEIMNDPARQPVLVHCAAGTQRTGCAVALYQRMHTGAGVDQLLAEAARYDHDPADNPHVRAILSTKGDEIIEAARTRGNIPGFDPVAPAAPIAP